MKGINQSYSMYDAKMFDDAEIMKNVLIEEQAEKKQEVVTINEGGQYLSGSFNMVKPLSINGDFDSRNGSKLEVKATK